MLNQNKQILPGIDTVTGLGNVLNDEKLFYEILSIFVLEHEQDYNNIYHAFTHQDISTVKHLVHTLKGVSGSIAATNLHNITKKLDDELSENDITHTEIPLFIEQLSKELSLIIQGIKVALIDKPALKIE